MQLQKIVLYLFCLLSLGLLVLASCSRTSDISPILPDQNQLSSDELAISDTERDPAYSETAENVLSSLFLGEAIDPQSGKLVQGYAIIHQRQAAKKPENPGGKPPKESTCYGFLSNGAKWKTIESWIVNPFNDQGLSSSFILINLMDNIDKWEDAADGTMDDGYFIDILGNGSSTSATLVADTYQPDGANEVYFGYISDPNTVAVTIIWGVFLGPPKNRELSEWDQVYSLYYDWSMTGESNKMDFESVATHELGHSVGLDDLYDAACIEETMYGIVQNGETNKRTLEAGDIAGVSELYN